MDMYKAIFKRKSIRNFNMQELDIETINDIKQYINNIKSYNENIKTQINIINDEKQVSGMFKVKAPYYVTITSEIKEDYLVNVGYILEQLVIYLTTKGIGTCWLGSTKPVEKIDKENALDFIVMIAFGKSDESIYRENISEFNRKSINEISNLSKTDDIMEAVRLSPSAMNKQPWYFEVNENQIVVYHKKVLNVINKWAKVDIGIALSHMYIAADNIGKYIDFVKEENKKKKGYEYIVTCNLI